MSSARPLNKMHCEPIDSLPSDNILFGQSIAMMEVRQRATKVCSTNIPVLLYGSGGTGKEVVARWIHLNSANPGGQFVKVNCAAIPGGLLESELFGFEQGAFTGAHAPKPGRVELAHRGTLFLDEIADLDLNLQGKLLQLLQDGSFRRIGGEKERLVETRLICATQKELDQQIDSGKFRADLYYRINVIRLQLPRLRERREDIPQLAEYFRAQFQEKFTKQSEPLSMEMLEYLQNLAWPGNIRELSNIIARHVLIGAEAKIVRESVTMQPDSGRGRSKGPAAIPLKRITKKVVEERVKSLILEALQAHQWNRRETAKALKISYRTLLYKIRESGLTSKHSRISATSRAEATGGSLPPRG